MFFRGIKVPSPEEGTKKSQYQGDVESGIKIEGVFQLA
jgi:hypothetical protein